MGFKRQLRSRWGKTAIAVGTAFLAFGALILFVESVPAAMGLLLAGLLLVKIGWALCRVSEECLRLQNLDFLIATTDSIVIMTDRKGLITGFNPAAERALGYSPSEVIGKMTPSSFHPQDQIDQQSELADLVYSQISGAAAKQEWTYVRKDGSTFPAIVTVSTIRNEIGEVIGHFAMGMDITARKAGEEALREQQELIESIAKTSPTIFYIFDLTLRRTVYANRQLPLVLGYSEAQLQTMGDDPLPGIIHPEDLDILFERYQNCSDLKDGEILEVEFRCLSATGDLRWLYARDVVFKRDAEGAPTQILVNVVDVTDKKVLDEQIENQVMEIQDTNLALEIQTNALEEANAQLEALAFTDGLTGIANHRSFQEELAQSFDDAKKRKRRLSLMLLDVDRFKQYNDTYGHPSGDIVLKRVAAILRESCPDGCMPARYGGEEFAVLCRGFSGNEVLMLAEQIRHAIEATPWPERSVTVSIGAVSLASDVENPSELVSAADNALYSSKASGRNCVTYYDFEKRPRMAG